jgi:hypothetical protein
LFLTNHRGELFCYESRDDRVVPIVVDRGYPIFVITTDSTGAVLVALSIGPPSPEIVSYGRRPNGLFECIQRRKVQFKNDAGLTPSVCRLATGDWAVGFWNGEELEILKGPYLIPHDTRKPSMIDHVHLTILLRPICPNVDWPVILWFEADAVWLQINRDGPMHRARLGWRPSLWQKGLANGGVLTWRNEPANQVELAGITEEGVIYWSQLELDGEMIKSHSTLATAEGGFHALTFVRENVLAAVKSDDVHFFRCGPGGITSLAKSNAQLGLILACYPCHPTQELLLISSDGKLGRLPFSV